MIFSVHRLLKRSFSGKKLMPSYSKLSRGKLCSLTTAQYRCFLDVMTFSGLDFFKILDVQTRTNKQTNKHFTAILRNLELILSPTV